MFYVFFVLILFVIAVCVHVFFCRYTSVPGLHTKAFIFIAVVFLCFYAVSICCVQRWAWVDSNSIWGLPFVWTSGIIFVLLVPVYLTFYVLTQLMSPSKKILLTLQRQQTLSYADAVASVKEEDFIGTRLSDLCQSGCVAYAAGKYVLNPSGRALALFLNAMQVLLGRETGG